MIRQLWHELAAWLHLDDPTAWLLLLAAVLIAIAAVRGSPKGLWGLIYGDDNSEETGQDRREDCGTLRWRVDDGHDKMRDQSRH